MIPLFYKWLLSISVAILLVASPANALPLWEIQGTSNRIYLLGSIHFLRPQDYPLPDAITRALDEADVIIMELDLSSLDPLRLQSVMMSKAIDPAGRSLEDLLGGQSYRRARDLAAAVDIDLATMRQYEPWYAALQVTQLRLMQLGFDGSLGVETHLLLQAIQQGKEIGGLETLEAQLDSMDSLPPRAQQEFLLVTLEDAADAGEKLDGIIAAWKSGDSASLEENLLEELSDHTELYDQLIVQRNRNWTKSIAEFANDNKDYLVVVGALHLVGNDSVLKMLDEKGFRSRQIKR
jgi:uncharacterized protein YbaP (TraB family)